MLDDVLRQVAARGRTVVMTSHDLARAADLAGRFDILSRGKVQASIDANQLPQDGLLAFYRRALEASLNGGGTYMKAPEASHADLPMATLEDDE